MISLVVHMLVARPIRVVLALIVIVVVKVD